MTSIQIATPSDKSEWNDFVEGNKASIFHEWEWRDVLNQAYGYAPLYLMSKGKDKMNGVFPLFSLGKLGGKRIQSIPFADSAGPVASTPAVHEHLMNAVMNYKEQVGSITWFTTDKPKSVPTGLHVSQPFSTFKMDTQASYEDVLKNTIHQKTRNMVFRAEREGIEVHIQSGDAALKRYYPLYAKTMLRLLSLPHPKSFFKQINRHLGSKSVVFMGNRNKKVIAGLWALVDKGTLYIWGNASDPAALRIGGNNAVYAAAIRYACEDPNIHQVDFGSTIPDTAHHFFKSRWGGKEMPIYQVSTEKGSTTVSHQKGIMKILKFVPRVILHPLSKLIYRYY
jgi:hypothetical protein